MALELIFNVSGNASKETKKLQEDLKKLNVTTKDSGTANKKLDSSLVKLAATYITVAGAIKLSSIAYNLVIKTGLDYNKVIEQQKASIATLIAVTSKQEDSMGNLLTTQEKYTLATIEATDALKELERINANTPNTLGETAKIFKTMLPSMKNVGATTSDLISLTEKLSIAANAGGVEFQSLLAGVDGLATGSILANSDLGRFLSSIGLTNQALKESDNVVGLLQEKLGQFTALDTIAVAASNLNVEWQKLTGTLTADLFLSQKDSIKELTKLIQGINADEAQIKALQNTINSLASSIVSAASVFIRFVNANRIMFADIGRGIENTISFAEIGLKGLELEFLKFSRNIREEIVDTIGFEGAKAIGVDTNFSEQTKEIAKVQQEIAKISKGINQNNQEFQKFRNEALLVNDIVIKTESVLSGVLTAEKSITKEKIKQNGIVGALTPSLVASDEPSQANKDALEAFTNFSKTRSEIEIEELQKRFEANQQFIMKNEAAYAGYTQEMIKLSNNITEEHKQNQIQQLEDAGGFTNGAKAGLIELADQGKDSFGSGKDVVQSFATNSTDAIMKFTETGKLNFKEFAQSVISDIARIIIQQQIAGLISSAITASADGNVFSNGSVVASANGNVFNSGNVQAFANGGAFTNSIVSSPTLFPMANGGTGLMGEAGAEAIIPLDRDSSGKLGVNASGLGGGGSNVTIIVNENGKDSAQVSKQTDDQGNVQILIDMVEKSMISGVRQGTSDFSSVMEGVFGLNRGGN